MKLWSQVEGDGVDPSQLQQESVGIDIFTSSHAKKQAFSRAKSLTWTETGNLVDTREGHMNDNLIGNWRRFSSPGSADSCDDGPNIMLGHPVTSPSPLQGPWSPDFPQPDKPRSNAAADGAIVWSPDVPRTLGSGMGSWNPDVPDTLLLPQGIPEEPDQQSDQPLVQI